MMMRAALSRSASRSLHSSARMMSGKDIKFGVEGRASMLAGVDLLADAVQVSFSFLVLWGSKRYHLWIFRDSV